MGRKLVQRNAVMDPDTTTTNIDNLKELFNVLGTQVTEGRNNLEKALNISETLMYLLKTILTWLEETEKVINERKESEDLSSKVAEMKAMKNNVEYRQCSVCLESEYSLVQLDVMNIQEIILVVKTLINQLYFLHTARARILNSNKKQPI